MVSLRYLVLLHIVLVLAFILPGCKRETTAPSKTEAAPETTRVAAGAEGFLDGLTATHIQGWAWDPNRTGDTLSVSIYDGSTLLTTVKADLLRPDLHDNKVGTGKYGFAVPIPAQLRDGKMHEIHVKFEGTDIEFKKSPVKTVIPPSS